MSNTITSGFTTFVPKTKIKSSEVNGNFSTLKDRSPLWQKFTVPFSSFQALGATVTGNVVLASLSSDEVIGSRIVKHTTAITGTSITAAVARVGKTGVDDYYTDDFDVFQGVGSSLAQKTSGLEVEFSSTSMILTLSLSGGLLSQLSTGSIDVYVQKSTMP